MINFDTVFDRVIGHEGDYVNDPQDPGGETKWGISKRSYPTLEISQLTRDQAKAIYYADFWMPMRGVTHDSMRFQMFDAAFNHGFGNAVRMLQRAVGVADDGVWGKLSQQAYDKMSEADLLLKFLGNRLLFMTKLQKFDRFGRGWSARIAQNLLYASEDNDS